MRKFTVHFDGSCWPNPGGTAAYGCTVDQDILPNAIVAEAGITGTGDLMSNNVAEFHALGVGLTRLLEYGVNEGDQVYVRGDSQIVINIMSRRWRPSQDKLYFPFFRETYERYLDLLNKGVDVYFQWIPRAMNTKCDDLSKAHNKSPK